MKRLIVLIGVVGISASAVLVRWSTAPSMVLVLYRMLIATAMMGVPTALRGREELKSMTKKELLLTMGQSHHKQRPFSGHSFSGIC